MIHNCLPDHWLCYCIAIPTMVLRNIGSKSWRLKMRSNDSPTAAATIPLPPLLQTQTNYWRQPLFFTGLLPTHDEWVNECIKPSLPCFLLTIKEKACRTSPSYEGEKIASVCCPCPMTWMPRSSLHLGWHGGTLACFSGTTTSMWG